MSRSCNIALIVILAIAALPGKSYAAEITDISVTPDSKRVAVKFEGNIGNYSEHMLQNPARLAIDIPGADVARSVRTEDGHKDFVQVRASKTASGTRLLLNFGAAGIPEYKIRKMDNYLIVFLGDKFMKVPPQAPGPRADTRTKIPPRPSVTSFNAPAPAASRGLSIKSAEVENGLIVLKVSDTNRPNTVYRIDLGVDFQHMGFSTANVHALQRVDSENPVTQAREVKSKIGPRRASEAPEPALPGVQTMRAPVRFSSPATRGN
jgi:hypothetical protein